MRYKMLFIVGLAVYIASTALAQPARRGQTASASRPSASAVEELAERPWSELSAEEMLTRTRARFLRSYEPTGQVRFENLDLYLARYVATNIIDPKITLFDVQGTLLGEREVRLEGRVLLPAYRDGLTTALSTLGYGPIHNNIKALPDPALGAERYGLVTTHTLRLQRSPHPRAEQLNEVALGDGVRLLEESEDGEWFRLIAPDGYVGWGESRSLRRVGLEQFKQRMGAAEWVRTLYPLRLRDKDGRELCVIPASCQLPLLGSVTPSDATLSGYAAPESFQRLGRRGRRGWEIPGGSSGKESAQAANEVRDSGQWVMVSLPFEAPNHIAALPADQVEVFSSPGKKVEEFLRRHITPLIGVRYYWGGISERGVDCSGFTQYLYRIKGVALARDADEQSIGGRVVAWSGEGYDQLRPGDLLFFANRYGRISHVAVSLGGTEFAQSAGGGVQWSSLDPESSLFDAHYRDQFLFAKRYVLKDE
jgi:cell wall-associated NlpC family hydrolase